MVNAQLYDGIGSIETHFPPGTRRRWANKDLDQFILWAVNLLLTHNVTNENISTTPADITKVTQVPKAYPFDFS